MGHYRMPNYPQLPGQEVISEVALFYFDDISRKVVETGTKPVKKLYLKRIGKQYFIVDGSGTLSKEVFPSAIKDLPADARRKVSDLRTGLIQISTVFEHRPYVEHNAMYLGTYEIWVPIGEVNE